ncbi:O-antigen ligase [uncultured Alistipes sp.]|uniref:O-antigen ligase family protein n=1 Tax=uncultured Alistipes sp. TaxID=538949 RepID=UPI002613C3E1|nr:O-antigen ligase family protein [uncultured Alistipes sp.]
MATVPFSPVRFCILNFAVYLSGLFLFGFSAASILSVCMGVTVMACTARRLGIWNAMALAITYLMLFDADTFSYTSLKLRSWYLLLLPLLFHYLRKFHFFSRLPRNGNTVVSLLFAVMILFWLVADPMNGKLSAVKYVLFSIGTAFCLKESFLEIADKIGIDKQIDFFVGMALFVGMWGIFQFAMNLTGMGPKFQDDYYNFRPSAFFSETTWYAEYLVFGMIYSSYAYCLRHRRFYLFVSLLLLFGTVLSVTRNAFLALAVWAFTAGVLGVVRGRIKLVHPIVFVGIALAVSVFVVYGEYANDLFVSIQGKFTLQDDSAKGRIEAFHASIGRIADSPLIGNGFGFDSEADRTSVGGTSIGAKHANLFLMIGYVFGLPGLFALLYLIFNTIVVQTNRWRVYHRTESKYAVLLLCVFISMSMFAPLFQFPFGMFVLATVILFSRCSPSGIQV